MASPEETSQLPEAETSPASEPKDVRAHGERSEGAAFESNDSGYVTGSSTGNTSPNPTVSTSERISLNRGVPIPFAFSPKNLRKKALLIFNTQVCDAARQRFHAIQPSFEKLLLEHVRARQKRGEKYKPMSSRVMMMGMSDKDARPYIVVFCPPAQKVIIERFVKNPIVKDLCKSGSSDVQSFEIAVMDAPTLRLSAVINVITDCVNTMKGAGGVGRNSFCGLPISLQHPSGQKRNVTFGGIIKVVTKTGDILLYGITAGHAVQDLDIEPGLLTPDLVSDPGELGIDDDPTGSDLAAEEDMINNLHIGDENDIEIELDPLIAEQLRTEAETTAKLESWSFDTPDILGSIIEPARAKDFEGGPCYDWALFKTSKYEMNKLDFDAMARITLSQRLPGSTGPRSVVMISGSGTKQGRLSSESGRLLLGDGEEFVDTYMLMVEGDPGICDGDSGSWVIDCETFELYGHLVASDVFNGGYVIPMTDIFDDIKQQLDVSAVELPSVVDILHARTVKEVEIGLLVDNQPPKVVRGKSEKEIASLMYLPQENREATLSRGSWMDDILFHDGPDLVLTYEDLISEGRGFNLFGTSHSSRTTGIEPAAHGSQKDEPQAPGLGFVIPSTFDPVAIEQYKLEPQRHEETPVTFGDSGYVSAPTSPPNRDRTRQESQQWKPSIFIQPETTE